MVCWHDLRGSSERAFQRLPHVCPQCPLFCTMEKELGGPSSQAGATVGITRHSSSLVPRSCPPSPDPFSLLISPFSSLLPLLIYFSSLNCLSPFVLHTYNRSFSYPPFTEYSILLRPVWPEHSYPLQLFQGKLHTPSRLLLEVGPLSQLKHSTQTHKHTHPWTTSQSHQLMRWQQDNPLCRCGVAMAQRRKRETLPSSSQTQVKPCCHHYSLPH